MGEAMSISEPPIHPICFTRTKIRKASKRRDFLLGPDVGDEFLHFTMKRFVGSGAGRYVAAAIEGAEVPVSCSGDTGSSRSKQL